MLGFDPAAAVKNSSVTIALLGEVSLVPFLSSVEPSSRRSRRPPLPCAGVVRRGRIDGPWDRGP